MRLTVKLDMNNAAFDTDMTEAGRILRKLADDLEWHGYKALDEFKLLDINGNVVGTAKVQ